jgi:hypothetical protein
MAASRLRCRVLMFTMHESERLSGEVRQAGAHGFVLKSQAARDLIRAIDCLLSGGTFFGSEPATEKDASDAPPLDSTKLQSARNCREPIVATNGANRRRVKKTLPVFGAPRLYGFDGFRGSNRQGKHSSPTPLLRSSVSGCGVQAGVAERRFSGRLSSLRSHFLPVRFQPLT